MSESWPQDNVLQPLLIEMLQKQSFAVCRRLSQGDACFLLSYMLPLLEAISLGDVPTSVEPHHAPASETAD